MSAIFDTVGQVNSSGDDAGALLLDARHVVQEFAVKAPNGRPAIVHAVSDVSFTVRRGETVAIVGESGSGKSTLGRSLLLAPRPKSGQIVFQGADLMSMKNRELLGVRRNIQMIFQDPFTSLDPKWRVARIIAEPMIVHGVGDRQARAARVDELLELVGLDPGIYSKRRPAQLSGGQSQRVAIARALALSPSIIVCDEAVSSLDVLIQAQVLNLFEDLRERFGLSYIFIAHDLSLVKQVSDKVLVMYMGKLCEIAPVSRLYAQPRHPYTAALLDSIPSLVPGADRQEMGEAISGEPPSPVNPPSGCRFRTRCPFAQEICAAEEPLMRELDTGCFVACHFPLGAVA